MGLNITSNRTPPDWVAMVQAADSHNLQSKWQTGTPLADIQEASVHQFTDFIADLSKEFLSGLADNPNKAISKESLNNAFNIVYLELVNDDGFIGVDQNNLTLADIENAISNAHKSALEALFDLQEIWADSVLEESQTQPIDIRPQIIRTTDLGDGNFEYAVIKRPLPPSILALCGGGAKGIVYPAALKALEEAGKLEKIETYSGTSAGGITSAFLAAGMSIDDYGTFTDQVSMDSLTGTVTEFNQKYTGLTINGRRSVADLNGQSGQVAVELTDQKLTELVTGFLDSQWAKVEEANLTGAELTRLEALRDQDPNGQPRDPVMLTFNDLSILRKCDPKTFKELELTGFNLTQKTGHRYNAENTPDMPIAYAVRITMSLPGLFLSVSLAGSSDKLVDGGFYTNVPKFDNDNHHNTLVMAFTTDDYLHGSLHGPSHTEGQALPSGLTPEEAKQAKGYGYASRHTDMKNVWMRDKVTLHESGANVIEVKHGKIGTRDLNAPKRDIQFARREALIAAKAHLARTENAAVLKTFTSLQDIAESLSEPERAAIISKGRKELNPEELQLFDIVSQMQ